MWRELLFLFLSAGIHLPYSIHMGQPPHDFNLGLQSWWGSQSRSFVLFWQRVGYISLIDPSDALPATWILNRMTQKDLQPFYHIHLGGTLLKRLLIIFCYLDLMSCSGTCPFPCRVLQIFLRICEIFYTCNNIDFFIVTRFDFTHLPPKKSSSNIHMYRNIQVLFEFTDDKITIEIF